METKYRSNYPGGDQVQEVPGGDQVQEVPGGDQVREVSGGGTKRESPIVYQQQCMLSTHLTYLPTFLSRAHVLKLLPDTTSSVARFIPAYSFGCTSNAF